MCIRDSPQTVRLSADPDLHHLATSPTDLASGGVDLDLDPEWERNVAAPVAERNPFHHDRIRGHRSEEKLPEAVAPTRLAPPAPRQASDHHRFDAQKSRGEPELGQQTVEAVERLRDVLDEQHRILVAVSYTHLTLPT